ncbi:MAG TPA: hypothetical protein VFV67_30165 [Actinophytocola sp.]|uniref:hypothetical protein n=1 Tax=Actinophytocola sp. TaxID=1872138 RepID=UPI002DBC5359|nr:hypothetical protein [Actinophytocola sp.]HEU5474929.1 hypothetical protein [Actinophytocola sp.]
MEIRQARVGPARPEGGFSPTGASSLCPTVRLGAFGRTSRPIWAYGPTFGVALIWLAGCRAERFYTTVFAWKAQSFGNPEYRLLITGAEGEPGSNGALAARTGPPADGSLGAWVCTDTEGTCSTPCKASHGRTEAAADADSLITGGQRRGQ